LLAAYTDKFEEIKTKMDLSNSDIRIISQAEVPLLPTGPGKTTMLALLLLLAFFSAISIALAFEFIDRGIETESDVKRVLNLKLLGTLPATKNPLNSVASKNRSRYLEEIKRIYLTLSARKGAQTILVTSANAREGKTTFALSLAQYLASIKSRVILVDADTFTPSLATLTGTEVSPGFAELMSGTSDFTKVIKRDGDNLPIIPAGDHDHHAIDIMGTNAFPQMLETLKSQYDFIILDSASALSSTDAEAMAGQVDNVIMVAQWNKTPKKVLKRVAENLRQYARDIPHVVLTRRA
jgi:capsular exopolysaccharide synthesis family protein